MNKRYFHALIFALAFLIAPLAYADVTNVSGGYVMASTDHQSMSDTKACMACHVAPESERQRISEYKFKSKPTIGGGTSNKTMTSGLVNLPTPYIEVGWQVS